ncbi:hypothetical protein GUJ93_ZPchr0013g36265 [Zizania palustris]|uniref:Uncharacterized protein n=1 Tax=Zizania palustris TaxID=103762 RepID=A0A8J5WW19_ZIZPA|nr:hypothetical protein GUJ93_ZPchr0013g36265 [Zizania palustris]
MSGANGSSGAEEDGEGNGDGNVIAASGGEEEGKRDGNGVETEEERSEGGDHRGQQAGILSAVASKIGIALCPCPVAGANGHGPWEPWQLTSEMLRPAVRLQRKG